MGATLHKHKDEITDDRAAFCDRTGLLWNFLELQSMGFQREDCTGAFSSKDVSLLLDHCRRNPGYHIISIIGQGHYVNRYIPDQRWYYLGDGDTNPILVLNQFLRKSPALVEEEMLAKAKAILADMGDGDGFE